MERFYTVVEVAEMMRISRTTVYAWMREGSLAYITKRRGKQTYRVISEAALRAFAEKEDLTSFLKVKPVRTKMVRINHGDGGYSYVEEDAIPPKEERKGFLAVTVVENDFYEHQERKHESVNG